MEGNRQNEDDETWYEEVEECAGYGDRFDKYNYTTVRRIKQRDGKMGLEDKIVGGCFLSVLGVGGLGALGYLAYNLVDYFIKN